MYGFNSVVPDDKLEVNSFKKYCKPIVSTSTNKKGVYQPNGALTTSNKHNVAPTVSVQKKAGNALINPSEVYKIDGFTNTKTIKEFHLS